MTFGDKLRRLREENGWSQQELAERSGEAQPSIAQWENGDRVPAFDSVLALCKALGVECSVFNDCKFKPVAKKRGRGRPKGS